MREKLMFVVAVTSMAFAPVMAAGVGIATSRVESVHSGRFVEDVAIRYCVLDSTGFEWYCSNAPIKGTEVK